MAVTDAPQPTSNASIAERPTSFSEVAVDICKAARRAEARDKPPNFHPPPWSLDFRNSDTEESYLQVPYSPDERRKRDVSPEAPRRSILKGSPASSRRGSSVRGRLEPDASQISRNVPLDGATFDPPEVDPAFGAWPERVAPHLRGARFEDDDRARPAEQSCSENTSPAKMDDRPDAPESSVGAESVHAVQATPTVDDSMDEQPPPDVGAPHRSSGKPRKRSKGSRKSENTASGHSSGGPKPKSSTVPEEAAALQQLLEGNPAVDADATSDPHELIAAVARNIAERIERLQAAPIAAPLASWPPTTSSTGNDPQPLPPRAPADSSMAESFDGFLGDGAELRAPRALQDESMDSPPSHRIGMQGSSDSDVSVESINREDLADGWDKPPADGYVAQLAYQPSPLGQSHGSKSDSSSPAFRLHYIHPSVRRRRDLSVIDVFISRQSSSPPCANRKSTKSTSPATSGHTPLSRPSTLSPPQTSCKGTDPIVFVDGASTSDSPEVHRSFASPSISPLEVAPTPPPPAYRSDSGVSVSQWGAVEGNDEGEGDQQAVALRAGSHPAATQDDSFDLDAELERALPRRQHYPAEIPEPDGRVRKSPAELAALMSSELQRLGDVEDSAQELNALEYARRLAEAQKLAERTARAVDAGQAAQQQEATMRAIQEQAVERMSQQVERVRSEVRSESLHQLQDVTQMFLQNLNYGKLVHANAQTVETAEVDVQTDALPPPPMPASPARPEPMAEPMRDASHTSSIPEDDLTESGRATGLSATVADVSEEVFGVHEESRIDVHAHSVDESIADDIATAVKSISASAPPSQTTGTESNAYSEDFVTESGVIGTASAAIVAGGGSSSIVDELRSRSASGVGSNSGPEGSSPEGGISQELRNRFIVAAERQAAAEEARLNARLKSAQERAAVQLRQLNAQKAAAGIGTKARRVADKEVRLAEMQLAMEEADCEQALASVRRDLRRQLLVWEQVTGAYLAGDLGPGGEEVLRQKLLQQSVETVSQHRDRSSDGSVAESIAAGPAAVAASEAATESVAYSDDFVSDVAGMTRDVSIVDEVGDGTAVDSYTADYDSIEDEAGVERAPTTRPSVSTASASQVGGGVSGGTTVEEAQLAELGKRAATLEKQRRQLAIQAEKARIEAVELEITRLQQGGSAAAAVTSRRALPSQSREPKAAAPLSGSHISDEADLRSVGYDTSAEVDYEDIADEVPSGVHSASNLKSRSERSGTVEDEVEDEQPALSSGAVSVDYTQDFEAAGSVMSEHEPYPAAAAVEASTVNGGQTTAYTDDFEEAIDPSSTTSKLRQSARSVSVLSEVSEAYSEVEETNIERQLSAESKTPRADAVAAVSGAVSEDMMEEVSVGSGRGSSDDDGGGGMSGIAALMDAGDIGAMLIEDVPLASEAPQDEVGAGTEVKPPLAVGSEGGSEAAGEVSALLAETEASTERMSESQQYTMSFDAAAASQQLSTDAEATSEMKAAESPAQPAATETRPPAGTTEDVDALSVSIAESIDFEDVEVEHEEEQGEADVDVAGIPSATEPLPPSEPAQPSEPAPLSVAPSPSGSNLEYTEDFEAVPSAEQLSTGSLPAQPAPTTSPAEGRRQSGEVDSTARGASPQQSVDEIGEESIIEDLDEELALEAHEQMLGYMTRSLAVEEATEAEATAARLALYHEQPKDATPASPSASAEAYTTEWEPEEEQEEEEVESAAAAITATAEDAEAPAGQDDGALQDVASDVAAPKLASDEEGEEAIDVPTPASTAYSTEWEADVGAVSISNASDIELDRESDLPEELEVLTESGELDIQSSGPIEAPEPTSADYEVEEAPRKSVASRADALADELLSENLTDALNEMCEAHTEHSALMDAFAAELARGAVEAADRLRVEVPSESVASSSPPLSPQSSLRHLPPLTQPTRLSAEPESPSSPSPRPEDSFRSLTGTEGSSDTDGEDTVRNDRKYVASYVADAMRVFLSSQNMSADSTDLEASRDMMGLQGFLDLERARPNVTNAQHIQNKLIYDAVNEALSSTDAALLTAALVTPRGAELLTERIQRRVVAAVEQRKELDDADPPPSLASRVLKAEAAEREREWNSYDEQLAELAIDIADQIWDDLTEEMTSVLVGLDSA